MLEHLGEGNAASNLMKALEFVTSEGRRLPKDLGGDAATEQVTDAVCEALTGIYT